MLAFRECTLATLDKTFGLHEVTESRILQDWSDMTVDISDFERQHLHSLRRKLKLNVHDWNETELGYNFIGPVMILIDFTTEKFNFFVERNFKGTVDGIEMGGRPDGMIASGFREPEKQYFCFQEYEKERDPEGDPAAQALAAMLVAQEVNEHSHPIYGGYVRGSLWSFMTLQEREYCISDPYVATRDDVFDIFRILKALRQIITDLADSGGYERAEAPE